MTNIVGLAQPDTRTAAQALLWNCSFSRSKFDALTDAAMKEKL